MKKTFFIFSFCIVLILASVPLFSQNTEPISDNGFAVDTNAITVPNGKGTGKNVAAQCPSCSFIKQKLSRTAVSHISENPDSGEESISRFCWHIAGIILVVLAGLSFVVSYVYTLRNSLNKLRRFCSLLPGHIVALDKDEKILYMSAKDISDSETHDTKLLRDIPNMDYGKISAAVKTVFETGENLEIDYECNSIKRSMSLTRIPADFFGVPAVIWFSHDNTKLQDARKKSEEIAAKLRRQTKLWDIVINAIPVHIFAKNPDDDFKFVFTNKSIQQFHGISAEDFVGKTDFDLFPPDTARQFLEYDKGVMDGIGESSDHPAKISNRRGESFCFHSIKRPFVGDDGSRLLLGVSVDVTEIEAAKEKIHRAERLLDAVLKGMSVGVAVKDADDGFKYMLCNDSFAAMVGKTSAEIVGQTDEETDFSSFVFSVSSKQDRSVFENDELFAIDEAVPQPNGYEKHFRVTKQAVKLDNGHNLLLATFTDISELHDAKRAAEENSEWFKRTLNAIGDGVITTDAKGVVVMMNPVAERMTGFSKEESVGRPHEDVFNIESYGESGIKTPSPLRRTLRTGTIVELANHTDLISRTGERYHISDSSAPIFDKNGAIVGAILIFHDITENYNQRDKLRALISQLEVGSELTQSASFSYNTETGKIDCSKQFYNLIPLSNGSPVSPDSWIFPEDIEKTVSAWKSLARGESNSSNFDFRVVKKGEIRYYRTKAVLSRQIGEPLKILGVVQDISDITRNFYKLSDTRNLWKLVMNSISTIFYVKDTADNFKIVICNKAYADFVGVPIEKLIGKTSEELVRDYGVPSSLLDLDSADGEICADGVEHTKSVADKNGEVKHFVSVKKFFETFDGRKLLLCSFNDITDLTHRIACEQVNYEILSKIEGKSDFNSAMDDIAQTLKSRMKCDRVMLAKLNPAGLLRLEKEWCSEGMKSLRQTGIDTHYALWDKNIELMRRNKLVKIADIESSELLGGALKRDGEYSVFSLIVAPIFIGGKLWGAIFVSYAKFRRTFTPVDESLMRSCANIISIARTRDDQQREIVKSDFEKQMILNNIKIPIWLHDASGNLLRANTAVCEFAGVPASELTTELNREEFCSRFPKSIKRPIELVLESGKPVHAEIPWNGRDFMVNADPVFNADGRMIYIVKSAVDLTDMNLMIKKQKLVNFCLETFFKEDNVQSALSLVIKEISSYLKASRILVLSFDREKNICRPRNEYSPNGAKSMFNHDGMSFNPNDKWFKIMASGKTVVVPEIESAWGREILGERHKMFSESKAASVYAAGLLKAGDLWGDFVVIYDGEKHILSANEIEFIENAKHLIELLIERDFAHKALITALENTKKSERQKAALLANEKSVNTCLNALFTADDSQKSVHSVLETILVHLHATNVFAMKFDEDNGKVISFLELTASPNYAGIFTNAKGKEFSSDERWFKDFKESKIVSLEDLDSQESLSHAGSWAEVFGHKAKSLYAAGIHADGKIWGDIGVVYADKHYSLTELELKFLANAGHLIEILIERSLSRERIVESLEKAKAADKAKSFFIASVSHEIRTPLNAVIGFSELLKSGGVSKKDAEEYLDNIVFSGNALLQLINDVLDLSKLEAGQMQIIPVATDFAVLGEEVMRVFSQRRDKPNLKLITRISKMPELYVDKMRLRQILFNLIGNAVKFTKSGTVTLNADFKPSGENTGTLDFSIEDTGIGISEEDQKKLMEPFVQLSKIRGTNAATNGTGLGLSICKRLAERMSGTAWLKSKEGEGSTFGVTLYDVKIVTQSEREVHKSAAENTNVSGDISALVIDDVPLNIKVLSSSLRKFGVHDISEALNATEALKLLNNRSYNVILTDMWMPDMNGAEMARKIKSVESLAKIPIIAVTADVEVKDNFTTKDFAGILLKPVTLSKIEKVISIAHGVKSDTFVL